MGISHDGASASGESLDAVRLDCAIPSWSLWTRDLHHNRLGTVNYQLERPRRPAIGLIKAVDRSDEIDKDRDIETLITLTNGPLVLYASINWLLTAYRTSWATDVRLSLCITVAR